MIPKNIINKLSSDLQKYKPIPLWAWNGKLEKNELSKQIDFMNQSGIGGFFMHARSGIKTEYLSEEWMQCVETCADYAKNLGMDAWIYDEHGWPSGFAGGKLLDDIKNHDKYLTFTIGEFDKNSDVSYILGENEIIRTDNSDTSAEYLNVFINTAASTVDILNPSIVKKFISMTHEKYKERFGDEFKDKIKGFFTDEPQYYRFKTPYSDMLTDYFKKEYNEDIFDKLGLLFCKKKGYRNFRHRYFKAMQNLMLNSFGKQIYDWCNDNGMIFTGHYIEETTLLGQMNCCAGVMPFYKYENMPGIDWLASGANNILPPRQLASVAAQFGKKQTLSESFGCCGWQISPKNLKRIADFEFVNGVNMLCEHFVPYAAYGARKKDYPAHFSPANPWVSREFSDFNKHFTRLGYLMSESREFVNCAVLHPIRSVYTDYDFKQLNSPLTDYDKNLKSDLELLNIQGISFHFLDETLLSSDGFVSDKNIGCGLCKYEYLILPHITNMDASTEKLLSEFVKNGGKILILGDKPKYVDGNPFDFSYLKSNCSMHEIISSQPFKINNKSNYIFTTYRNYCGTDFIFTMNSDTENSHTFSIMLDKNIHSLIKLDLITLNEEKITNMITLAPGESMLLFPSKEFVPEISKNNEYVFDFNNCSYKTAYNILTVDNVKFSKDGKNYSDFYPCPGLFAKLLEDRYEGEIYLKYQFEVRDIPKFTHISMEKCNGDYFTLNGNKFEFTKVSEIESHLLTADISEFIKKGTNDFVIKMNWHQDESVYYALFGENVTESLRNCLVYNTELEAVYISGDFGVYPEKDYVQSADKRYVYGENFYIAKKKELISEPTTDGLPFFAGSLKMYKTVEFKEKNITLRLNGSFHIAYVKVNGNYAGKIIYSNTLDISQFVNIGQNNIEIEFIIGNRNLLGPHHVLRNDEDGFVSPDTFELKGKWKDGKCPLYLDRYSLLKLN